MNKQIEIQFGLQECSKCEYNIRCEECVYNEKDISELIKFEQQQARKETAREIFNNLLKEFYKRKSCGNADVVVYEIAKQYGVEVEK